MLCSYILLSSPKSNLARIIYKRLIKSWEIKLTDVINVIVWGGMAYFLFVFLRGMNETQVKKHQDKLDEAEKKNLEKTKENNIEEENV